MLRTKGGSFNRSSIVAEVVVVLAPAIKMELRL